VEYSSAPRTSASGLLTETTEAGRALEEAARATGLAVVTRGIDPVNPVEAYPLLLGSDRYLRLARHLAHRGPAGARMMRQTASIQVNLSWGEDPLREWDAANRISPYLLALFANSPRYGGEATGHRSFRAWQWRNLDPTRTGLPLDPDRPVEAYLEFALGAGAILLGRPEEEVRPFGDWLSEGGATFADWRAHLTTLFPEVRPRGYLEIRGLDALPIRWWAVPLAIAAGILRDPRRVREVLATLGIPSEELLQRAGREGLGDADVARAATWVWELGLEGCSRLPGEGFGTLADLARRFDQEVRRDPGGAGLIGRRPLAEADPGAREEPGDPRGPVPIAEGGPVKSVR
jgi:glutamate--cysteine ligase